MPLPILATKLYIPPPRPELVSRPRLVEGLNGGLHRKLTLISAPAGFGKTTLAGEWVANGRRPAAWLSLDEGDSDPARFLAYLVAALQTVAPKLGQGVMAALQTPQPPPPEAILTALLNELAAVPHDFVLVLDDYHLVDAKPVDDALAFLLEHQPPQMHLAIATREDPSLPLARLRARDQLTELRAADLRFTATEAAEFLNQVMGLGLAADDIAALEARTEGWIAGLQLAALSMQGRAGTAGFIKAFSGSHRFVLDYLLEEVLHQQPADVQAFLLRTSVLNRMCGPLCDAVLGDSTASGQATLAYLERANLFVVPLDSERRWYRYHYLFGDLLRQRLLHEIPDVAPYHIRASAWYEANGLDLEAFHHAVAAHDVDRAARLVEGEGMPLLFRGAVAPVLSWLAALPAAELDARPALWVIYASALLFVGQLAGVEQKVRAAEAALQGAKLDDRTRDLIGHIASIRATVAVTRHDAEAILAQSQRALAYLHPNNLPVRAATTWTLGYAHHLQGDRAAAGRAYAEALASSQAIGHFIIALTATLGLANLQETDNQLHQAAETYRRALELAGDPPLPVACEAHHGLARICYAWNDLDAARQHGEQSVLLARQLENSDRAVASEIFLARLALAREDVAVAAARLAQAGQAVRQHSFVQLWPELAAAQVEVALRQDNQAEAARLAEAPPLPLSQARVHLAWGDAAAALAVLEPWRQQAEARGWPDERLKVLVLEAMAHQAHGEEGEALQLLRDALALAETGGFIRIFVDEGEPMARLLAAVAKLGIMPSYTGELLAAFAAEQPGRASEPPLLAPLSVPPLLEPLSPRELEVLQLVTQGLSNREIAERLFLAIDTVKGHNRRIYEKLQVQRRTEAIARARELGLL